MDVRQLRYFLSVADLESFSRAAAALRIAQPALSRQIRQLEHELGVQLFSRHARGVHMTAAGRLLRERACLTLRQIDETRHELMAAATDAVGQVAIGMPPSLRRIVTGPLLNRFRHEYPGVFVKVVEEASATLNDAILAGGLDLAVVGNLDVDTGLEAVPLARERLLLVGPRGFVERGHGELETAHLARFPLALTGRPNSMRMIVENAAHRAGLPLRVVMEADHFPLLIELIRAGNIFTVAPHSACESALRDGLVDAVPIRNLYVTWTLTRKRERRVTVASQRLSEILRRSIDDAAANHLWFDSTTSVGQTRKRSDPTASGEHPLAPREVDGAPGSGPIAA